MPADDHTSTPSVVVLKPKAGTSLVIFCLGIAAGLCLAAGFYFYKHDKPGQVSSFQKLDENKPQHSNGQELTNGWQEGSDGQLFHLQTLTINDSEPVALHLPNLAGRFVFIWDGLGRLEWQYNHQLLHWRKAEMHQSYDKAENQEVSVRLFGPQGFRLFCFFYPEQSQDEFEPQT